MSLSNLTQFEKEEAKGPFVVSNVQQLFRPGNTEVILLRVKANGPDQDIH